MQFQCTLVLPRDVRAVPTVRRFCSSAMTELGVQKACLDAIAISITEACSNVVKHSAGDKDFSFRLELADKQCTIRVTDHTGFRADELGDPTAPDLLAERGRGLFLISSLMDSMTFETEADNGTSICLTKTLEFEAESEYTDSAH